MITWSLCSGVDSKLQQHGAGLKKNDPLCFTLMATLVRLMVDALKQRKWTALENLGIDILLGVCIWKNAHAFILNLKWTLKRTT